MKSIKKILSFISEYTFSMFALIMLIGIYMFGEINSIMGTKTDVRERFWDI